jgi:hypothetical protein
MSRRIARAMRRDARPSRIAAPAGPVAGAGSKAARARLDCLALDKARTHWAATLHTTT